MNDIFSDISAKVVFPFHVWIGESRALLLLLLNRSTRSVNLKFLFWQKEIGTEVGKKTFKLPAMLTTTPSRQTPFFLSTFCDFLLVGVGTKAMIGRQ